MRLNIVLLSLAFLLGFWWYPLLPDTLAAHFDAGGMADGWMSKDSLFILFAVLLLMIFGMFASIGPLVRRVPDSMINLPYRDIWLSDDRREETLSIVDRSMHSMCAATLLFMTVIMQMTFIANLQAQPRLGPWVWPALILYLAVLAFFLLRMYRRFRRVDSGRVKGES
jgi:uncharacterized membrane protein